jgi:hypothetical protein
MMLDAVLPPGQAPERSTRIATHLVRFALDELAQIERLDENLAPEDPLSFDRPTVAWVRGMYERWAEEVASLLARLDEVETESGAISGAGALRDAHGRTRAMLSVSLDQLERGARDIRDGRTTPIEEARRELRLRVR